MVLNNQSTAATDDAVKASLAKDAVANAATLHVLLVEDDHRTANALSLLLRSEGFGTTTFHSGTETLRSMDSQKFDAVLVDVHLPDMSGLVLSQRLRERLGASVPIMVVSGDTSMETLNSLSHVGATYFLAKPVNPQLLLEQLRLHTSGHPKAECA